MLATRGSEHFFVAERCRALYLLVPKAACTTMLWGILEFEGHDPLTMNRSQNARLTTPDVVVHDRALYPVPTLEQVRSELGQTAVTSPDWLRFAIVRNPYARLYSAWESKILLNPRARTWYHGAPELVETDGGVDVGASFRAFVAAMAAEPGHWHSDGHFCPQADILPLDVINDIELVPTSAISALFERFSARAGVVVAPRRTNEGLGIDGTAFLDSATADLVATLYSRDFELTGHDRSDYTPGPPVVLDSVALSLLRLAAARSDRAAQLQGVYERRPEQQLTNVVRRVARRLTQPKNAQYLSRSGQWI